MKTPQTRRRERRILEALQALGPLDNYSLAEFLGIRSTALKKPLLNLTLKGQITATAQPSLMGGNFIWKLAHQENTDG